MSKTTKPTYLDITPEGAKYFQQMIAVGYTNLLASQRIEWNILHDLSSAGEPVRMSTFLAEGRDSALGQVFSLLSERAQQPLVLKSYGTTLHRLITQKYVKAYR